MRAKREKRESRDKARHERDTREIRERQERDERDTQVVPDVVPQVHLIFDDSRVVVRAALVSQDLINVHARKLVERSIGAVSRYLKILALLLRQILHPVGQLSGVVLAHLTHTSSSRPHRLVAEDHIE